MVDLNGLNLKAMEFVMSVSHPRRFRATHQYFIASALTTTLLLASQFAYSSQYAKANSIGLEKAIKIKLLYTIRAQSFPPGDGGGGDLGGGSADIFIPPKTYSYNYGEMNNVETNVPTLTTSLMGDTIDPASGGLKFTHNDASLPGNFGLPVNASRTLSDPDNWYKETLEFGNWSLNLPHVRSSYVTNYAGNNHASTGGTPYWAANDACSGTLNDNPSFTGYIDGTHYELKKNDYWNGDFISIPGKGSTQIIRKASGGKTTKNFWKISCVNSVGVNSFEVTTTDGTKYLFGKLKVRQSLKKLYMGAVQSACNPCVFPPLDWEESLSGSVPRKNDARMLK
jgi:hypothetical protein